jgi:hypothetical protein
MTVDAMSFSQNSVSLRKQIFSIITSIAYKEMIGIKTGFIVAMMANVKL